LGDATGKAGSSKGASVSISSDGPRRRHRGGSRPCGTELRIRAGLPGETGAAAGGLPGGRRPHLVLGQGRHDGGVRAPSRPRLLRGLSRPAAPGRDRHQPDRLLGGRGRDPPARRARERRLRRGAPLPALPDSGRPAGELRAALPAGPVHAVHVHHGRPGGVLHQSAGAGSDQCPRQGGGLRSDGERHPQRAGAADLRPLLPSPGALLGLCLFRHSGALSPAPAHRTRRGLSRWDDRRHGRSGRGPGSPGC
jgi:hypothetical protein